MAVRNNSPVCKHLDLGNEPMGLDPLPLPSPFSLTLFLSVLFRARLPFLGRDHPLKGGLPELQLKVQPAVSPAERDQSGTSFSATLRPGWALANPRLSKSRGTFSPTPGDSWTGGFCCNCPGVCCQAVRLSASLLSNARCPLPHCPPIHSIRPPNPPAGPHHITLPIKSMNQPGRPALAAALSLLHSTPRLGLS